MSTNFKQTPEEAMRDVTTDMIRRAIRLARRKRRTVYISKTSNGKRTDIATLDPSTRDGAEKLTAYLTPVARHYTFSGLGAPEEEGAINWRTINLPPWKRPLVLLLVALTFVMKGTPAKNKVYRLMGM